MGEIRLLDCTLRDGGYVNDWEFGHSHLNSIFERLVDAKVDIIEVGFLDDRRPFDINRSIMPDTPSAGAIWKDIKNRPAMVVGMIDYGTCSIDNLQPCEESWLDGIRVIFKKHLMHEAMEFCRQVKALGYKVFSQLVSITSYNDEELLQLVELVNDVKPYAVSMVDTYGLLHPEDLLHYYQILDEHVCAEVQIGFHAHNNFQLAYANALAFLEKETKHDIVVDGTLYGMGKSAGNAPIELLAMRLNEKFGKNYRIPSLLEAIEESVLGFYGKSPWGYKLFFYLCGLNKCHPNYVTYLKDKQDLSVSKIDELLSKIGPEEKKLLYDKLLAEQIYSTYINGEGSDKEDKKAFRDELGGRTLLLVGPGKNTHLQYGKVDKFIKKENPYVLAINFIPEDIHADCVFVTNLKRYQQMTDQLHMECNRDVKILATSNVECRNGQFDFVVNRAPLLEKTEKIIDNSFLMLLKLLVELGIKKVVCAGFDGYSEKEDNYFNPEMEYYFVKDAARWLNNHMQEAIYEIRRDLEVKFLTYSAYDEMEETHDAAF